MTADGGQIRSGLVKAGRLKFKKLPAIDEIEAAHGIAPHEFNVLVLPRELEAASASGLIQIPEELLEREQDAVIEGMLVAVSPAAFSYAEYPADLAKPAPGQHVYFKRYAGEWVEGDDGRKYRLMGDKSIIAVRSERSDGGLDVKGAW